MLFVKHLPKINLSTAALALGLAVAMAAPAGADPDPTPVGKWVTPEKKAVIEISPCGNGDFCGAIVGMAMDHATDPMPKNWQGGPQCGMTILQTAPAQDQNGDPEWVGTVLDPRDGNVYRAQVRLNADNNLVLHGYVGLPIFGQTQTWTPYNGDVPADCRLSTPP